MSNSKDEFSVKITGHVLIKEYESREDVDSDVNGKELMSTTNDIHMENASLMIARALGDRPNGSIYSMYFGNGGATVDPLGNLLYASPNVTGQGADLNNPLYFEVVDDNNGAPQGNSMSVRHVNGTLFSDLEVRAVIDKNSPFGAPAFDNLTGTNLNNSDFVFSEIGLKSLDDLLFSYLVFAPILKSSNRILSILYTLRIRIIG